MQHKTICHSPMRKNKQKEIIPIKESSVEELIEVLQKVQDKKPLLDSNPVTNATRGLFSRCSLIAILYYFPLIKHHEHLS